MITAKPNELELLKFWQESDPATGIRINFPVDAQTGAASSAAIYFEVESEQHIGRHMHSAGTPKHEISSRGRGASSRGLGVPSRSTHHYWVRAGMAAPTPSHAA